MFDDSSNRVGKAPAASEALRAIRRVREVRLVLGKHARTRMRERRIQIEDIVNALEKSKTVEAQPGEPDKWSAVGPSLDGRSLKVVVVVEDDLFVVTVWWIGGRP